MLRCRQGRGYHPAVSDATSSPPATSTPRRCDLHLHTRYSYSEPVDVFDRAKAAGMDYVAITDHDSIEGALGLLEARPDRASEIIVGEEVETRFPDTGQP